ncbi:ATP-dependent DNA helicase [Cesiribacter andamanensis]|uniref:Exonuclease V subunit alpha n=1 Tax=Cesiribacter andamanensis AMV16 TaxID=1279009 RepID=M7N8T9_9BACT|nr:AAA family ATPase [Cesiribacter andamanensis]EMR03626.1 exonuclease V subunit alpha [Cesiribacter andamanensis AMV16]
MPLTERLHQHFPFSPTAEQEALFRKLADFMAPTSRAKPCFLLKGYAGTGKTVVLQALTKSLRQQRKKVLLLAPTGRAAKILSKNSGQEAYTIHSQLYKPVQHPYSGQMDMQLRKNYHRNTLVIVDEASMLSGEGGKSDGGLLADLTNWVYSQPGNALLLVGDPAQLPPVGERTSLALEEDVLRWAYGLDLETHSLSEVSRQQQGSGILANATYLRQCLEELPQQLQLTTSGYRDVFQLPEERLMEGLRWAYQHEGAGNTLFLCATNEEAAKTNALIRSAILGYRQEVVAGDLLMIARNNYQALPKNSKLSYLANGEFAEVTHVMGEEQRFGFRFLRLKLRLPDEPALAPFESFVLMETLDSRHPSLPEERSRSLFEGASRQYRYMARSKQVRSLRKDPYLNALQVKFAYALTCHKAQGGQWKTVLLQPRFWVREPNTPDKLRWFYTAITRASDTLYLLNARL